MSLIVNVVPSIGVDSEKFPKHEFKLGYFHSDYSENGFDSVLRLRTGLGLKYIFFGSMSAELKPSSKPNWTTVLKNTNYVIGQLQRTIEDYGWFTIKIIPTPVHNPSGFISSKQAFDYFVTKNAIFGKNKDMSWITSKEGKLFLKNRPNVAAILSGVSEIDDTPVAYAIFEASLDQSKYYFEGLEIIKETAEYILKQEDPSIYEVHWKE